MPLSMSVEAESLGATIVRKQNQLPRSSQAVISIPIIGKGDSHQ